MLEMSAKMKSLVLKEKREVEIFRLATEFSNGKSTIIKKEDRGSKPQNTPIKLYHISSLHNCFPNLWCQ